MAQDPPAKALRAMSGFVVVADTLHGVAETTRDAVPAAASVGIAMFRHDRPPTTALYTDERGPRTRASSTSRT